MPRDKLPKQDPDLLDKLFGDPAELGDKDIDALFETLAPGTDATAIVHRIAESAAVGYRTLNRVPPDHIQSALEATRQEKSLEKTNESQR